MRYEKVDYIKKWIKCFVQQQQQQKQQQNAMFYPSNLLHSNFNNYSRAKMMILLGFST